MNKRRIKGLTGELKLLNDDCVKKLERPFLKLNQMSSLLLQPSVETRSISGLNNVASNSSVGGLSVDMVVADDIS